MISDEKFHLDGNASVCQLNVPLTQKGRCDILAKRVRDKKWGLRCQLCIKIMFASECITIEYLFPDNYNSVQCKQNLNFSSLMSCCLII